MRRRRIKGKRGRIEIGGGSRRRVWMRKKRKRILADLSAMIDSFGCVMEFLISGYI